MDLTIVKKILQPFLLHVFLLMLIRYNFCYVSINFFNIAYNFTAKNMNKNLFYFENDISQIKLMMAGNMCHKNKKGMD